MTERIDPEILTSSIHNPTLKSEGNFMPTDIGHDNERPSIEEDIPAEEGEQKNPPKEVSPERIKNAKEGWAEENERARREGRPPSHDLEEQKFLIKRGVAPMPGGQIDLLPDNYTDPTLKDVAEEFNKGSLNRGGSLDIDYYEKYAVRVRGLKDSSAVNRAEANALLNALDNMIIDAVAATPQRPERTSMYGDVQIETLVAQKGWLDSKKRTEYFNNFFALVDATPHESFEAILQQDWQSNHEYRLFVQFMLKGSHGDFGALETRDRPLPNRERHIAELKRDFRNFLDIRRMRQSVHDIKVALVTPSVKYEQFAESAKYFESKLGDIAFKQNGVLQMMKLYEEALRDNMRKNRGFLEPEAISGIVHKDDTGKTVDVETGETERITKKRFEDLLDKNLIVTRDDYGNKILLTRDDLTSTEIDKAFAIAQGMMLVDGRLISIMAESTLPKDSGQAISKFLQDILANISPYRNIAVQFGFGGSGLAALMYKPDQRTKKILGIFSRWNPAELKKTLDRFDNDRGAMAQAAGEYYAIMRLNPNRAGDIFTNLTWRAELDRRTESALKDFLENGRKKMGERWNLTHPNDPRAEVYEQFIEKLDDQLDAEYRMPEYFERTKSEGLEKKKVAEREKRIDKQNDDWQRDHPGAPSLKKFEDCVREHEKWVGTGLKFEKIRWDLFKFKNPEDVEKSRKTKPEERQEEIAGNVKLRDEAKKQIQRMVELQPQRLYRISQKIRDRLDPQLTDEMRSDILKAQDSKILNNLSLLESVFLAERENLLDAGKTFDSISLDDFYDRIENPHDRDLAKAFAQLLDSDFRQHTDLYMEEFVYKREYHHGFVLWSEDAPIDEFNMTKLGPTGGFARKIRDNKGVADAGEKEKNLFNSLKHIREPEDLYKAIEEIYNDIVVYDRARAQSVTGELLEGIAKFFAGESQINIPGYGMLDKQFGKSSFARHVFGRNAPVWSATQIRDLYAWAKDREFITHEEYERLNEYSPSTRADVALDVGVTLTQLLAIAIILYIMQKSAKEKSR